MDSIIPRHQWTNNGDEVLIVKWVPKDGRIQGNDQNDTYYDFMWPLTVGACVEAPDWDPIPECGHGLHGWPWAFCLGEGKECDWSATWLVFGANPADVVAIDGKCKARCGIIRYVGDWQGATNFVLPGQMAWVAHAARGAASATGESGAAVVTGLDGYAQAGAYGCIALAWWNCSLLRIEMRCAEVGCGDGTDGKLKAKTWYRLNGDGEFIEEETK